MPNAALVPSASVPTETELPGSGSGPAEPHSRECILARLAEPIAPDEDLARGSAGVASFDVEARDSSAGGRPDSAARAAQAAIELQLDAGALGVLVVFDKSSSMSSRWDERTKWEVANAALANAIDGVLDQLTIGSIFFPDPGGCEVEPVGAGAQIEFMGGRAFRTHWHETAPARWPQGSTPLGRAFQVADSAIELACRAGLLEQRFRVLLVTDGEPTCDYDTTPLVEYATEWHRLGIETWVLGIPGSASGAALLDAIAAAGGTEKHQSLGDPAELEGQLFSAVR